MGLVDSFEEDISSPSNSLPRINVEELFDDPKYVCSKTVQVSHWVQHTHVERLLSMNISCNKGILCMQ